MSSTDLKKRSIKNLLQKAETIAIIGCSQKEYRTSYQIAKYLKSKGYRIIPVNPNAEGEVLGEKSFDNMQKLPPEVSVDIVDIFRNSRYTEDMVRQVAEWSLQTGQKPVVWTQLDVSSPEAEEIATDSDLDYVKNRCIYVEHNRLIQNEE